MANIKQTQLELVLHDYRHSSGQPIVRSVVAVSTSRKALLEYGKEYYDGLPIGKPEDQYHNYLTIHESNVDIVPWNFKSKK